MKHNLDMQLNMAKKFSDVAKHNIIQMWSVLARRNVDLDRIMIFAVDGIGFFFFFFS
jgi:hypothetical protein